MTGSAGMVLGEYAGEILYYTGPSSVLLFAPPRSGKGISTIIPTLLTIGGSVVVHDLRGEAWEATAGSRQRFSHCVRFDPTSPTSIRIDPLLEIRKGVNEVKDAQNFADMVVDPDGSLERRDHWQSTAGALIVGATLHVLYAEHNKSPRGVADFLSDPARDFKETLSLMKRTCHLGDRPHPVIASSAQECLNRSQNELSGVLSTAMSYLGLYKDPVIARATSASDIRLADLMRGPSPISLYLVVPPSDISRTRPLIRLLLNQLGRMLTEDFSIKPTYPLLLLLDEMPALGRLEFLQSSLAYLAGYQIRALLVAQSLNQLDHVYGNSNSIMGACEVRVCYAPNDMRTAKTISDLLGVATEVRTQSSLSGSRFSLWLSNRSVTTIASPRPLMTPGEVLQLPPNDVIILQTGQRPMLAQKLRYFDDERFQDRILPSPALTILDVPPHPPSVWLSEKPKPVLEPPKKEAPCKVPPLSEGLPFSPRP